VEVAGTPVSLTPTEFLVLRELLMRRGEAMAADALSSRVWGYEIFGDRNYLEAQISRLRSKLAHAGAPTVIETFRGFGYIVR
jgi:two-component system OmpR family response regulator